MDVKEQTLQLKEYLDTLRKIYEANQPPESRKDKEFFLRVKEATTPIYNLLENWEEQTLQLVKQQEVNVHPHQVTSTRENMELLLMHSYYVDVKRKRYMELNKSVHYIFDQLLSDLI